MHVVSLLLHWLASQVLNGRSPRATRQDPASMSMRRKLRVAGLHGGILCHRVPKHGMPAFVQRRCITSRERRVEVAKGEAASPLSYHRMLATPDSSVNLAGMKVSVNMSVPPNR